MDRERIAEDLHEALSHRHGAAQVAIVVQEDRELVAPEPRRQVVITDAGADPLPHHDQQVVAGRVPERVVHVLEVVEVEQQDDGIESPGSCPAIRAVAPSVKSARFGMSVSGSWYAW